MCSLLQSFGHFPTLVRWAKALPGCDDGGPRRFYLPCSAGALWCLPTWTQLDTRRTRQQILEEAFFDWIVADFYIVNCLAYRQCWLWEQHLDAEHGTLKRQLISPGHIVANDGANTILNQVHDGP